MEYLCGVVTCDLMKYIVVCGMHLYGLEVRGIVELQVPYMRVRTVYEDVSVYAMARSKRFLVHLLTCN